MITAFFYWLGVGTFCLASLYGLSEGGLWLLDRLVKSFGLSSEFWRVARRKYRERLDESQPPAG